MHVSWNQQCFVSTTMQDQYQLPARSLIHCLSCPLTHRAATKNLYSCLSPASYWMEFQLRPKPLISVSTVCHKINFSNTKLNTNLTDNCQTLLVYNITFQGWWWKQINRKVLSEPLMISTRDKKVHNNYEYHIYQHATFSHRHSSDY